MRRNRSNGIGQGLALAAAGMIAAGPLAAQAADSAGSVRRTLERAGVALALSQTFDGSALLAEGPALGAYRVMLDASIEADLGMLLGWKGASLLVQQQAYAGENGSGLLGDVQGFSNIDAEPFAGLAEAFLQQVVWQERLRVKLGRMDVAAEFAAPRHGAGFLNSSFGLTPSIAGAPTYPAPATGASVHVAPLPGLALSGGAFAVARGLAPDFGIAELALGEGPVRGRVAIGAWRRDAAGAAGQHGWYALADRTLWQREARTIDGFAQYGAASASVREGVREHAGAGVVGRSLAGPAWLEEQGLAVSWVRLAPGEAPAAEWVLEAYAGIRLSPAVRTQLDVQRIASPGAGADARLGVTLRAVVEL